MTEHKTRKPTSKELKYLQIQKEHNKCGLTWRQFYERIQGQNPHWMTTSQYGGDWLDKKMGEFIG